MRRRFSIILLSCCLFAFATPSGLAQLGPQSPRKSPTNEAQRPSNARGTPSLSPMSQTSQGAQRSSISNRSSPRARSAPSRQQPVSMVPAPTDYRQLPAPPTARERERAYRAGRRPYDRADRRSGYRPANNRPDVVLNRPDINMHPSMINRSATNINQTTINNTTIHHQAAFTQAAINRGRVRNSPFDSRWFRRDRPPRPNFHSRLHYQWQPSGWLAATYRPAFYNHGYVNPYGGWLSTGQMSWAYANPFFVQTPAMSGYHFDYSQPIPVPAPDYVESRDELIRSEQAIRRFDDARELFRRGEYGRAHDLIDEAIGLLPNDPTLHQFRSLVLFARERFQESAAVLYAVVAVSSGWDADTLRKLYDSPETYLAQVASLEQFVEANPDAIESQFLLAYHRVVKGDFDQAGKLLQGVLAAHPNDRVVQSVIAALGRQSAEADKRGGR